MPSANATLAWGLWRLGVACDIAAWRELARNLTISRLLASPSLERATRWTQNWLDMDGHYAQVVIAGGNQSAVQSALSEWWSDPRPATWVEGVWPDAANIPSWMEDKRPLPNTPVRWYVCVEGACGLACETGQDAWQQVLKLRS